MTYESASEAQILKSYWRPDGPLENTVFAILDPSGRPLTRGSRDPGWFFRDARDMAYSMDQIASRYQSHGEPSALPTVATVRLAFNVAACDKTPLCVVVSKNGSTENAMEREVAKLAWSRDLIGKLTYASGDAMDLSHYVGAVHSDGFYLVAPDEFGTSGQVVAQLPPTASAGELRSAMQRALVAYRPMELDHREHIRMGRQSGIRWQTAIPVTDPHALQAERMGPP